jgi:hypothetical protein
MEKSRAVSGPLLLVSLALLAVGFVSHTPVRHLIQILPLLIALAGAVRGARWAAGAAHPMFVFWLLLMTLIWCTLLGLPSLITGQFTPAEIALTLVIGVSCVWGFHAVWHTVQLTWPRRIGWWLLFALLQLLAMAASTRPLVSHR